MVKRDRFYKSGRPIEFKTCARTKEQAPIISKIRTMIITNFFPFIIFTSEGLYQIFNTQWNKIQDYYTLISKDGCFSKSSLCIVPMFSLSIISIVLIYPPFSL